MLASQAVEGEGLGQPTEPQHTPTTASPSYVEPIPTVASSSHPKKTYKHRKTKIKVTEIPQSSEPTNLDAYVAVYEERGDSMERAATTASLDAEQDSEAMWDTIAQTRSERVSTPSYDSPLLGVNIRGSDEERVELKELMDMCTKLSDRVLDLENPRVESSEESLGEKDASKQGRNSDKTEELNVAEDEHIAEKGVSAAEDKDSTADPVTTAGETVTTVSVNPEDSTAVDVSLADDVTLAETLMAIRSSASRPQKLKGVLFKELSEPTTITTSRPQPQIPAKDQGKGIMQEPEKPVKVKGKDQIEYDADVAQRLQAELDKEARLEREREEEAKTEEQARLLMEIIAARKKFFAAKRAEEQRNKPPTKAEQIKKMCTYMKHMARYKDKKFKGKSFDAIKQMFGKAYKQVNDFVPMDIDSSGKKAENSKERTRAIVPNDDSAVNIESLDTKYPIVDWKTHILAEDIINYQIIRADGSTKYYKLFSAMLDDFDRQDVLDLYRLVKEIFKTTSLEGYDKLLWGDLITLFKPSEEDEIWKTQQDYTLISWKLYDSCGVHLLLMDAGTSIHVLVEKKYPLTQEMLSRMLCVRLEVDHECEMAFKLLRFTRSQLKK
ncbi:hypothetical protein Tco_0527038 [Tanacetum coccineum]